jgi:cobalamin-dependent methionine synthase I
MLAIADNLNAATPWIAAALAAGDADLITRLAVSLRDAGADALDLNLGFRSKGGPETAAWVVRQAWGATGLPLCIDTADPVAMRAAMEAAETLGLTPPPIINSFSLEKKKIDSILPLAAQFSAPIVGYCVRDVVPQTPEERLELAVELVELADAAGVARDLLYLDPILFPLARFQDDLANVIAFFETVPRLFDPPVQTMAAVSNIGHGLAPQKRRMVESTVLSMLAALGLDAALLNMLDPHLRDTLTVLRAAEGRLVFSGADLMSGG